MRSAGFSAEDIAKPAIGSDGADFVLGEVGLECATMWRQVYGARLGCHDRKRVGAMLAGKEKGTFIGCKRGVLKALGQTVSARAPPRGATTVWYTDFVRHMSRTANRGGQQGCTLDIKLRTAPRQSRAQKNTRSDEVQQRSLANVSQVHT